MACRRAAPYHAPQAYPYPFHAFVIDNAAPMAVLIAEPMAVSLDQAGALVCAAGTASGLFRAFGNFLLYPPVQRTRGIIDSGEPGDIHTIVIRIIVIPSSRLQATEAPLVQSTWLCVNASLSEI